VRGVVAGVGDRKNRVVAERISIPSLRARVNPEAYHCSYVTPDSVVFALVEAVESAHRLSSLVRPPGLWDEYEWDTMKARAGTELKHALDRFDFGEQA
jgi:hypothetical protein